MYTNDNQFIKTFLRQMKHWMLLLASNTQGVEARIKDVTLRNSTGRSKSTVSNIGLLRSVILNEVTEKTMKDPSYINRPRKNESSKDYLPGKHYNNNILS